MSTRLANQSLHVTCQPGTMAMGSVVVVVVPAMADDCRWWLFFGLGAGKDFGETGEGESDMVESWEGDRGQVEVVMWEMSWAERVWYSSMRWR